MNRRRLRPSAYIAAFALTTLIFIAGILLGSHFSAEKLNDINVLAQELQMNTMGTELQYEILLQNPCDLIESSQLTEELFSIGERLGYMESSLGSKDLNVLNLKEYYHLLEIRHWLFVKKTIEECGLEKNTILYFYSNAGDCNKCEEQGNVLVYMHRKYPELNIYSFDINIDNPALNTVKDMFSVAETPSLVIDGETYIGFMDAAALKEVIFGAGSAAVGSDANETENPQAS